MARVVETIFGPSRGECSCPLAPLVRDMVSARLKDGGREGGGGRTCPNVFGRKNVRPIDQSCLFEPRKFRRGRDKTSLIVGLFYFSIAFLLG